MQRRETEPKAGENSGDSKLDKAATVFQKVYRGHLARTHYQIKSLTPGEKADYKALLMGNDPDIN